MKTDSDFREAYERLAQNGECDTFGGMESFRLHREWIVSGRPDDIAAFIRERANLPAP